jgi:hypothetical protein
MDASALKSIQYVDGYVTHIASDMTQSDVLMELVYQILLG